LEEEEEAALAAEALAAGCHEGAKGAEGDSEDLQLARDYEDENAFTDEDVNNIDEDDLNIREETQRTQPTQPLTHKPTFTSARD